MRIGMNILRVASCFAALALTACASGPKVGLYAQPETAKVSRSSQELIALPYPAQPVAVAVYGFTDQTGQFSPSETTQTLSRALTQGATSVLVQSLREAGQGRWFTVLEREHLDNLLKERQVITEMRQRYLGEKGVNPEALPSLLFAGVLLEGGVIGYDVNTQTGGAGARLLGIGANVSYQQDTITVYIRAVATKTGEVLASVVTRKTVVSTGLQGGAFRYISYQNLLETEVGYTVNEPRTIALEQAVQKATYDLVLEGSRLGVWSFADKTAAAALLNKERPGAVAEQAKAPPSRPAPAQKANTAEPKVTTPGIPATAAAAAVKIPAASPQGPAEVGPPASPPPAVAAPPASPPAGFAVAANATPSPEAPAPRPQTVREPSHATPMVQKASYVLPPESARPVVWSSGEKAAAAALINSAPAEKAQAQLPPPAPALERPETKPAVLAKTPAVGRVLVQIGAYSSAALADKGWDDAAADFPSFMMGKSKRVEPVERAGETFYRASVAGFTDTPAATAFCRAMKAKGQDCLVKNRPTAGAELSAAASAKREAPASAASPASVPRPVASNASAHSASVPSASVAGLRTSRF